MDEKVFAESTKRIQLFEFFERHLVVKLVFVNSPHDSDEHKVEISISFFIPLRTFPKLGP